MNTRTPSVENHPRAKHQLCVPHTFSFGHVRQLDAVIAEAIGRAWRLGAGPGDEAMTVDVDSTICEVHGKNKQGAAYGYTRQFGLPPDPGYPGADRRGPARPAA